MSADKQYADAKSSLSIIEREVIKPSDYLTYGSLAIRLSYDPSKYSRHIGQVCSLIDAACYWAKLPSLSLEKVRLENGVRNPDSFSGPYNGIKNQLILNAEEHLWTSEDITKIKRVLDHMNGESAILQWARINGFGQAGLDRMVSYK